MVCESGMAVFWWLTFKCHYSVIPRKFQIFDVNRSLWHQNQRFEMMTRVRNTQIMIKFKSKLILEESWIGILTFSLEFCPFCRPAGKVLCGLSAKNLLLNHSVELSYTPISWSLPSSAGKMEKETNIQILKWNNNILFKDSNFRNSPNWM